MSAEIDLSPRKGAKSGTIAFGYRRDPDDPELLIPIPRDLEVLQRAIEYVLAGGTYRNAQKWVEHNTGKKISHISIFKRVKEYKQKEREKRKAARQNVRIQPVTSNQTSDQAPSTEAKEA